MQGRRKVRGQESCFAQKVFLAQVVGSKVKSEPGAARLGCPAAAGGKPVCDAPCHPPPPGREPGPCGVPAGV